MQLGNVKDIHQSDCPHCQWFDKTLPTFWNCYLTLRYLKKNKKKHALLSLFLTAYHYSLGVFSPAKDTKASAIEGCQTWMSLTLSVTECMSSLDIYVSLKPEAIKILNSWQLSSFWGCSTWISTRSCGMQKTVCPVYLPLFHPQYASHGPLLKEWF